jgi:zinc transporter ZupT
MSAKRLWIILPFAALAAVIGYLLLGRPLTDLTETAPPVEELTVTGVELTPGAIALTLRADGSEPVTVAQVQVDGAYRTFTATPSATIGRLGTARLDVPFPWVEGEAHHVAFVTSTGAVFDHRIDVAVARPALESTTLAQLVLVGLLLGIVPVGIGLLSYPALRSFGPAGMRFVLALTVGLLLFLLVDTLGEGLEHAGESVSRLHGVTAVWVAAGLTAILLLAIGRSGGRAPEGIRLAYFIAFGIGLHNLGEGLAVGAALAAGSAALATFLVIGFVVHNVTEGVGIAAPTVEGPRPSIATFAGLAALAGLPAILGTLLGTAAVDPYWTAICFGIGAGAILQVIIEVTLFVARKEGGRPLADAATAGGVAAGLVIMYATALLV